MSNRPVLGIIACQRTVGIEPAQAVMERYIRAAMTHANVAALIVPSLPDLMSAAEVAPRLDAILLTGSPSNVDPARYQDEGGEGPFDPGRDAIALSLVERMIDASKPVFGICRGFQEINVALGGTLRRDTSASDELLRHHAPDGAAFDAMFDHLHPVHLSEGGMLARAFGKDELEVNSVHFQGVGRLAPGLAIEAKAPDGLVEAYSARPNGAPVIAVQWHPEWDAGTNPDSAAFFRLLGRAMRGEA
jgi:putative glutamine amidotransferase